MHEDLFVQWAEQHLDGAPFNNARLEEGWGVVDLYSLVRHRRWTGRELRQTLRQALDAGGFADVRLTVDYDRPHGLRFFNLAVALDGCTETRLQALAGVVSQWKREHGGGVCDSGVVRPVIW